MNLLNSLLQKQNLQITALVGQQHSQLRFWKFKLSIHYDSVAVQLLDHRYSCEGAVGRQDCLQSSSDKGLQWFPIAKVVMTINQAHYMLSLVASLGLCTQAGFANTRIIENTSLCGFLCHYIRLQCSNAAVAVCVVQNANRACFHSNCKRTFTSSTLFRKCSKGNKHESEQSMCGRHTFVAHIPGWPAFT